MRYIDIHSHVLHGVDDGSKSLDMSLEILSMMGSQGITDVIATPHFDARYENFEEYRATVTSAFDELKSASNGKGLPNIYLGSEVYYFKGIGKSNGIRNLTLADSKYLLLELSGADIDDTVIKEIQGIYDNVGLIPILAHLERYATVKGFKKLLKLFDSGLVMAQINAPSVIGQPFKRAALKLIKKGYVSFIATDAHSTDRRPPMLSAALDMIEKQFGVHQKSVFLKNSQQLLDEISKTQKENIFI